MPKKFNRFPGRSPKIYLPTPKQKKEIKFPKEGIKLVIFSVILAAIVYILFYSPYFTIKNVNISGTKNEEITTLANSTKGKNLWLLSKKELLEQFSKYPEIDQVSIQRRPLDTLKIKITEKAEGIIWQTQGIKYLLDIQGVPIKEVIESGLPSVVDSKNAPVEIGKPVVTPIFVNFIKNLNLKFTSKTGLPLKEITVPAETTFEVIVQTEGFKVIFDTQGNLDNQIENMTRVYQMKKDEIKEYMDLRIDGRVYYK